MRRPLERCHAESDARAAPDGWTSTSSSDARTTGLEVEARHEVAPIVYSLTETAKLHDVDPERYPREAVRAADRGEVLLPSQFAASPTP